MFGREGKSGAAEEEAVVPLVAVDVAVPVVVADPAVVDDAAKGAPPAPALSQGLGGDTVAMAYAVILTALHGGNQPKSRSKLRTRRR